MKDLNTLSTAATDENLCWHLLQCMFLDSSASESSEVLFPSIPTRFLCFKMRLKSRHLIFAARHKMSRLLSCKELHF